MLTYFFPSPQSSPFISNKSSWSLGTKKPASVKIWTQYQYEIIFSVVQGDLNSKKTYVKIMAYKVEKHQGGTHGKWKDGEDAEKRT